MRKLRSDIIGYISHGLAVIAVMLFVVPLEAAHSNVRTDPVVDWSGGHLSADGHDHGDGSVHSASEILQGHCDPGPDCSNSYAVFNSIAMTIASSGFHNLFSGIVNLSAGRITPRDIPPPKRIT